MCGFHILTALCQCFHNQELPGGLRQSPPSPFCSVPCRGRVYVSAMRCLHVVSLYCDCTLRSTVWLAAVGSHCQGFVMSLRRCTASHGTCHTLDCTSVFYFTLSHPRWLSGCGLTSPCVYLTVCLPHCVFTRLRVYLTVCLAHCVFTRLRAYPTVCLPHSVFTRLRVYLWV